jgi:hypothetical protein
MKPNKHKKEEEFISIQTSWLETLNKYYQRYLDRTDKESLDMLLGYLATVDFTLKMKK